MKTIVLTLFLLVAPTIAFGESSFKGTVTDSSDAPISAAWFCPAVSVRASEAQKGESHMKQTATLTTASLLTILFITVHLTGDILFRMSPAGLVNLFAVFFLVVQLYGTLVLGGTRAGYIIIFLCSALGLFISVIHMKGTLGVIGGDIGNSGQAFLFVWTILALGVTSTFSVILSASALLSLPWRRTRRTSTPV